MAKRAAVAADHPVAQEAAEDVLLSGGSALGAVAAGFFAAAGASSGVLLSPITVLLAGVGIGARAFDGRLRQPGLGTRRPRGFQQDEPVPEAAHLAVPAAVPALLVALAYDESLRLSRLTKNGVRRARDTGAVSRASLIEGIRGSGSRVFSEPSFVRPMLHVGGPAHGGLLTPTDFQSFGDLDKDAARRTIDGATVVTAPWADESTDAEAVSRLGHGHAIVAADARGAIVALHYRRVLDGITIDALELDAPNAAIPVLRGETRVAPGACLSTPAPVAIWLDGAGTPVEVRAWPAAHAPFDRDARTIGLRRDPATQGVVVIGSSEDAS
jgi:gamma-glutamyltranspeptidase/glutathione hydrolase